MRISFVGAGDAVSAACKTFASTTNKIMFNLVILIIYVINFELMLANIA
jgi:hypothetical protein